MAAHRPGGAAPELAGARRELRLHPRLSALLSRRLDPTAVTGLLLSGAVAAVVLAATAVGVLLAMVRAGGGLARTDLPLARWAAEHVGPTSGDLVGMVTLLGGTEVIVLVAVGTAAAELRRSPRWSVPALLGLTVGGQFALVAGIKWLVGRARPDLLQLTGFAGASFPSGHATAAAATYACVALLVGRSLSRRLRALLAGTATGIATAVAATRVLLGVHWFTDVIAGMFVGWGWFAACSMAFGGRVLRFGEPVAVAERLAVEAPAAEPGR